MSGTEELALVMPGEQYAAQYMEYRQEFLDAGSSMDGTGPLRRLEDPYVWLAETERYRHPETVPEGKVAATQFLCVRPADDRLVGMIQVRHTLNAYLAAYGGHIGYSVRPSERRKGYAKWMLKNVLPWCRARGMGEVWVNCLVENEGSRRTILANGGVYRDTVFEPDRQVHLERYRIVL